MTRPISTSLAEVIRKSPVQVIPGEYWYYKTTPGAPLPASDCLAIVKDGVETTLVAKASLDLPNRRGPFVLFRLEVVVPFDSPGFIAAVSSALSVHFINVLIISTYTYDYLLIRVADYEKAVDAMKMLGLTVRP